MGGNTNCSITYPNYSAGLKVKDLVNQTHAEVNVKPLNTISIFISSVRGETL